jgi:hemerythrin
MSSKKKIKNEKALEKMLKEIKEHFKKKEQFLKINPN